MQADRFKELPTAEDMNIGFEQGFDVVVERWRSLSGHTARSSADPSGVHINDHLPKGRQVMILTSTFFMT